MAVNPDSHIIDGADGDILMEGVASNESSDEGVQETIADHHLPNGKMQPEPDEVPDETTKNTSKPQYALKYILSGHTRSISSIKFSPDGTMLASSGAPLSSCAFCVSADSKSFWKQAADKLVKLWDTYTGEILRTFEGHNEGVNDISWSSDGEFLASASDDKSVILWSLETVSCRCSVTA